MLSQIHCELTCIKESFVVVIQHLSFMTGKEVRRQSIRISRVDPLHKSEAGPPRIHIFGLEVPASLPPLYKSPRGITY